MFRIPTADMIVSVALAAILAGLVACTRPQLSNDSFTFTIGNVSPIVAASLPTSTFAATVTGVGKTPRNQHRVTLNSPAGGLFTVTGAAFYELGSVWNMQLWTNGSPVTFSMLEGKAEAADLPATLRPIAQNVRLRAGNNELVLCTTQTEAPIVLRLQRQAPTRWGWPAAAGLALLTALWSVSILANRMKTGFLQAAAVITGTLVLGGAVLGWIGVERGAEFVRAGDTAPDLDASLRLLDTELTKGGNSPGAQTARVFTFGDSTHQFPRFEFKDALKIALDRERPGQFSVYGLAHGGMTGRDYYLLLNKVLEDRPDVLVLPINVATFEDRWYNNPMWYFDSLEPFLRLDEFPRALRLRVGQRRFQWEHILLRKADAEWFDRKPSRFLGGLRSYVDREAQRLSILVQNRLGGSAAAYRPNAADRFVRIAPDSDMVNVFRAINALARKHGIRVIYYTTPLDDEAQKSKGVFFQPRFNFDTIQRELAGPSHVTFLKLHESFPMELLRDDFVHLKPAGIQYLADHVAQTVETLATDAPTPP